MESEQWIPSRATSRRPPRRSKGARAPCSCRVFGGEAVKQIADLGIAGDRLHAEEGVTVGTGGLCLHAALEAEEGGGLEEEGSKGAGGGIGDGIALVGAAAGVGERGGGLAELCRRGSRRESETKATFYGWKRHRKSQAPSK